MYTILMDCNKSLITPKRIILYQGESLMDSLKFLIPKDYNGTDLSDFEVKMQYMIPGNVGCNESLVKSDEEYNETHLCYYLPIDSKITQYAGDITLSLIIYKYDSLQKKKFQLHTGKITLSVKPTEAFYQFADGDDSSGFDDNEFDVVEFSEPENSDFDVVEF